MYNNIFHYNKYMKYMKQKKIICYSIKTASFGILVYEENLHYYVVTI